MACLRARTGERSACRKITKERKKDKYFKRKITADLSILFDIYIYLLSFSPSLQNVLCMIFFCHCCCCLRFYALNWSCCALLLFSHFVWVIRFSSSSYTHITHFYIAFADWVELSCLWCVRRHRGSRRYSFSCASFLACDFVAFVSFHFTHKYICIAHHKLCINSIFKTRTPKKENYFFVFFLLFIYIYRVLCTYEMKNITSTHKSKATN